MRVIQARGLVWSGEGEPGNPHMRGGAPQWRKGPGDKKSFPNTVALKSALGK